MATLIAEGILSIANYFVDPCSGEIDDECDPEYGLHAFDNLTVEQKIWSLHKITFGLLSKKTPVIPHTAYLEATIMAMFYQIIEDVQEEIVMEEGNTMDEFVRKHDLKLDHDRKWKRKCLLAVYETRGLNDPENIEDDEQPLTVDSKNLQDWKDAIGFLEGDILWDYDFTEDFDDMPPEAAAAVRRDMTIDDDYHSDIPNDPPREEANKLLSELRELCFKTQQRERKSPKKKQ